jgi:ferritin-like metal-binding protein YciE
MTDVSDRITFIDSLNDLLSAENTVIERLDKRILLTHIQELKKMLQEQLKQEHKHQSRLENLIAYYGGKPTNSRADLIPLIPTSENSNTSNNNMTNQPQSRVEEGHDNSTEITQREIELSNAKEDLIIKNAEILEYRRILKVSEKLNAKDAINIIKQNLKEEESMFKKIKNIDSKIFNKSDDKNIRNESFKLGSAIGDVLTSYWNSKENPSKVYIFNRRVHHGGIGALLGLSSLYKKQPIITGILSGLGARLAKDDYKDSKEWFAFKKKEDDVEGNDSKNNNTS